MVGKTGTIPGDSNLFMNFHNSVTGALLRRFFSFLTISANSKEIIGSVIPFLIFLSKQKEEHRLLFHNPDLTNLLLL